MANDRDRLAREAFAGVREDIMDAYYQDHTYEMGGRTYPANGCTLAEVAAWAHEQEDGRWAAITGGVGPDEEWDALGEGAEVYYTGDRANREGFGVITAETGATGYAPTIYTVTMRDGRTLRAPAPYVTVEYPVRGTRFVLASAYRKWRREELARLGFAGSK